VFNLYEHLAPPVGPQVVHMDRLNHAAQMATTFTLAGAARTLRRATPDLDFLTMYREFLPDQWRRSKANPLRSRQPSGTRGYFGYFSDRELEFFEMVDKHLLPLETELYGEIETEDPTERKYIELLVKLRGWGDSDEDEDEDLIDEDEVSGLTIYPGVFLLRATAGAWVCDPMWVNVCRQLGLESVRDMPHFLKHVVADHYNSLTYNTLTLFPALRQLGPKWKRIDEIWEYATGRTRSDILNLRDRDFGYRQLQYPEFVAEALTEWSKDWAYGKTVIAAFDTLADELARSPSLVKRYLRLLAESTLLSDNHPEHDRGDYEIHSFSVDEGDPMVESFEWRQFERLGALGRGMTPKIWPEYESTRIRYAEAVFS